MPKTQPAVAKQNESSSFAILAVLVLTFPLLVLPRIVGNGFNTPKTFLMQIGVCVLVALHAFHLLRGGEIPVSRAGTPKLMLLAVLLNTACNNDETSSPAQESNPNLLLITLDTVRADRVGCYGYDTAETPVLDSWAEKGVLFEQAHANVPLTLPSHGVILTGKLPSSLSLRINGIKLDSERNKARGVEATISADDSHVQIMVIPTNEELIVARQTQEVLSKK